jgi:hypothetical protein
LFDPLNEFGQLIWWKLGHLFLKFYERHLTTRGIFSGNPVRLINCTSNSRSSQRTNLARPLKIALRFTHF